MAESVAQPSADPKVVSRASRVVSIGIGVLGFAVSGLLVWLAVRRVDWDEAKRIVSEARFWPAVPLAVGAYLLGHLLRGLRLSLLVRGQAQLGGFAATNVVIAGYASNNVFPARLGELVRVGLLSARTGMPVGQALSLTVLERVVDGLAILLLLSVATLNTVTSDWVQALTRLGALVLGSGALVLAVAVIWPGPMLTVASRLGNKLGRRVHLVLVRLVAQVTAGVSNVRKPTVLVTFLGLSVLVWTFEALMFVALFGAFDLPLDFWRGTLVMGITNLGILAPSTPGFVGTFHYFCAQALQTQGVSATLAVSYAVAAHLTFFIPITLWGAWVLVASGIRVGATVAAVRAARNAALTRTVRGVTVHVISTEDRAAAPIVASAFLSKLVEASVTFEGQQVDEKALAVAVRFTQAQLKALSALLRIAFFCGTLMFRTYCVLRYFAPFTAMSPERRRRAVESWAFGRIALFRQLFRPVRSVALLAYYETAGAPR